MTLPTDIKYESSQKFCIRAVNKVSRKYQNVVENMTLKEVQEWEATKYHKNLWSGFKVSMWPRINKRKKK